MVNSKHKEIISGFLAGLVGGILIWFVTDYLAVKQDHVALSSVTLDSSETRQGSSSLRWDFTLQPDRKYMFSPTSTVGGLLHLEVRADSKGHIQGLDLQKYKELRFFAKASSEVLILNEINLFTGPNYIQYMYSKNEALILNTKWAEYRIDLEDFSIAPWELQYRSQLVTNNQQTSSPDLRDVTSLGFDLKTDRNTLSGRIWIDYIRLIDKDGNEEILSDEDDLKFVVSDKSLIWISAAREYP